MTVAKYEERNRVEWEGSLYWHSVDGPIIPSDNIERTLCAGAMKDRLGKQVQAAAFMSEDHAPIEYDGPRDLAGMYALPEKFVLRKGVKVMQARIIRVRAMFPVPWVLNFTIEFDPDIIDESALKKANQVAGAIIGTGDHRPKFGRFLCEFPK